MPEIIIQSDGSILVPRGSVEDNRFMCSFLKDIVSQEELDSLSGFFSTSEESEIILGQNLCG